MIIIDTETSPTSPLVDPLAIGYITIPTDPRYSYEFNSTSPFLTINSTTGLLTLTSGFVFDAEFGLYQLMPSMRHIQYIIRHLHHIFIFGLYFVTTQQLQLFPII